MEAPTGGLDEEVAKKNPERRSHGKGRGLMRKSAFSKVRSNLHAKKNNVNSRQGPRRIAEPDRKKRPFGDKAAWVSS
jgi:hypothetical protein